MKISIVTISYNQAQYLETCIQSILDQDYNEVEYIVVDAGSIDGSREIIQRYRDRISHIIFEPDKGPADGLNKGFSKASGDIFGYINADDVLLPETLSKVGQFFTSHPNIDVMLGHGYQLDENGHKLRKIFSTDWTPKRYALGVANAIQQATFFRWSALDRTQGFNIQNKTCWDGELLVDMALAGAKVKTIDIYLGAFRVYPESISGSGRLEQRYRMDQESITQKILGRAPDWRESCAYGFHKMVKHALHPKQTMYKLADRVKAKRQVASKATTL